MAASTAEEAVTMAASTAEEAVTMAASTVDKSVAESATPDNAATSNHRRDAQLRQAACTT